MRDADLVLALGVRLGEMTTGGYTLLEAPRPKQKLVHVHAGAEELGRVYAADLMLQASMACAAKALEALGRAGQRGLGRHGRRRRMPTTRPTTWRRRSSRWTWREVMKTMQRLAPADTVYTNGAGNFSGWLHRYVRYPGLQHHGRTQLAPTSGAMGYGVPAAVAAALLHPRAHRRQHRRRRRLPDDRPGTRHRHRLRRRHGAGKLISIVVDNGTYGTIRMHQEREYPGRVSGSDLFNPDFVALARAYGWRGQKVEATAEFEPAFAAALAAERPTLIHIKLDADVSTTRTTLTALRAAALKRGA